MHAGPYSLTSILLVTRSRSEPGIGSPIQEARRHWERLAAGQTEGVFLRGTVLCMHQRSFVS